MKKRMGHLFSMECSDKEDKNKMMFPIGSVITRDRDPSEEYEGTKWVAVSTVWIRIS